jgi:hypothetical protein
MHASSAGHTPFWASKEGRQKGLMRRFTRLRPVAKGLVVECNGTNTRGKVFGKDAHERALSVLRGAQQLDLKQWTARLGGTLIVDDEEHRTIVQEAWKQGNLSFGFSAGGCLFGYYLGVSGALMDAGIINASTTKLGGASAGSLIAACVGSGMSMEQVTEQTLRLMEDCRRNGTRGRLGPVLEQFLDRNLPEDAHERCNGRIYIAVTKALPYVRPVLINSFETRSDLIRAMMTSSHVPWWLDGRPWTEFRGELHLDGGLTNFIPTVPDTVGVRVCCFPSKQLSPVYRIGISPDSFGDWPFSLRQMVAWAFEPADEATTQYLIEKGKHDAEHWLKSMGLEVQLGMEQQKSAKGGEVANARRAASDSDSPQIQKEDHLQGKEQLYEKASLTNAK